MSEAFVWEKGERNSCFFAPNRSRTLCGCVDWNLGKGIGSKSDSSRTLCGCVDWNLSVFLPHRGQLSRTLCGCVDWNMIQTVRIRNNIRRTLCGCVDWNGTWSADNLNGLKSHPMRVRGLKRSQPWPDPLGDNVAPYAGAWIETKDDLSRFGFDPCRTLRDCVDWN